MQRFEQASQGREVAQAGATSGAVREKEQLVGEGEAISPCPNCGAPMSGIRGSKGAICRNCGFKDSCCY